MAILSIGITAQAEKVAEAQSQAAAAMEKVMIALTGAGIDKKDIQTQYYNIIQVTNYYKSTTYSGSSAAVSPDFPTSVRPVQPPTPAISPTDQSILPPAAGKEIDVVPPTPPTPVTSYQVSNMLTVKVRAIDKTGEIIDAATTAGGDLIRVNNVYFSVDQPEKYYAEVRTLAVNDAKAKATSLADLAGVNLGVANYISENNYLQPINYGGGYRSMEMYAVAAPSTALNPGQTEIVLNVQMIFTIQ